MSRRERRRGEQRKEQARIWGVFEAVALAVALYLVPRLPMAIVAALSVLWVASWPVARNGYKYRLAIKWTVCIMIAPRCIVGSLWILAMAKNNG